MQYWQDTGNKALLQKIEKLLDSILDNPYKGIGKPEALKHQLAGKWSRRITKEDRMVYTVNEKGIIEKTP
ncbi:MAG: Txe/YoeB family addiction module toxin [Cyclobacteriaceae bacterium]